VKATFLKGVVLGTVVSALMLTTTAAFAGSGVGAVFNLGRYNGVNGTTKLAGSTAGKQLDITNTSNGTGATGIGITVHSGKPPLAVNSSTKITNLNADQLDGLDSSKFQPRVSCPAGLQRAADICFETSIRADATWTTALSTCALANRRLPDDADLAEIFNNSGAPQTAQWASPVFLNQVAAQTAAVLYDDPSRNISVATLGIDTVAAYRCVVTPN